MLCVYMCTKNHHKFEMTMQKSVGVIHVFTLGRKTGMVQAGVPKLGHGLNFKTNILKLPVSISFKCYREVEVISQGHHGNIFYIDVFFW